jgi:hypothetical protein
VVAVVCLNLSESTETLPHQWCLGDLRIWGLQFCVAGTRKRKGAKVDEHRAVAPASLSGLDRLGTRRRPLAASSDRPEPDGPVAECETATERGSCSLLLLLLLAAGGEAAIGFRSRVCAARVLPGRRLCARRGHQHQPVDNS